MKITSLEKFQEFVRGFPASDRWIFRGQLDSSWELSPRAGRLKYSVVTKKAGQSGIELSADLERFEKWRSHAKNAFHDLPENDFDCLGFAQHYGLVTRLLDWTKDPLVALFFAVQNTKPNIMVDGVVFAHKPEWLIKQRLVKFSASELAYGVYALEPEVLNPRVIAQKGLFTYHKNPWADFRHSAPCEVLKHIEIDHSCKKTIREQLRKAGYSKARMFPDIETISKKVNHETRLMAKKLQRIEEAKFGIRWNV